MSALSVIGSFCCGFLVLCMLLFVIDVMLMGRGM